MRPDTQQIIYYISLNKSLWPLDVCVVRTRARAKDSTRISHFMRVPRTTHMYTAFAPQKYMYMYR